MVGVSVTRQGSKSASILQREGHEIDIYLADNILEVYGLQNQGVVERYCLQPHFNLMSQRLHPCDVR